MGKRIRVFWPDDDVWYEGFVKHFCEESNKYTIVYDDGEKEHLILSEERYELI